MRKTIHIILKVIFPLFIGGLIYILFRTESLKMFVWFDRIGISSLISYIREEINYNTIMPNWIIFSLPDALWLYAFTNLMLILWNYKFSRQSSFWILIAPFIGLFSELGQAMRLIPGTFDYIDLILIIISMILSFILINKNQQIKFQLL